MSKVDLKDNFKQVCVWPGCCLKEKASDITDVEINDFVDWMKESFNVRVQFLEQIETFPDRTADGTIVEGTGGRSDIIFAVHNEDVMKFAIPRLQINVRWIEDAISNINGGGAIYPKYIKEYCSWNGDPTEEDVADGNLIIMERSSNRVED